MTRPKMPYVNSHIIYDVEKTPNEIRCLICNERLPITSPFRLSTFMTIGKAFARRHRHERI
jgi:hypothetical protein